MLSLFPPLCSLYTCAVLRVGKPSVKERWITSVMLALSYTRIRSATLSILIHPTTEKGMFSEIYIQHPA
jgi:hypothetical protein